MNFKTLFSTAAVATVLMSTSAFAADIVVSKPWARASAGMASAGAAFMAIYNDAKTDDTLVDAKADISKRVELHTHTMVDGVMQMRQVEGGIPIPASGTQMLQPGSYHVMFMGLNAPLKEGSTFPLTLTFKSGAEMTVDVEVLSPSAMGNMGHGAMPAGTMPNGAMDHKPMEGMPMDHKAMPGMTPPAN
ncbi:MAG TPA: copper chaperone PCu(A)C [Magnetovibrio sp.]